MSRSVDIAIDQRSNFSLVLYRARDQRNQVIDMSALTGNSAFKISYSSVNVAFTLPITTNANGEVILSGNTTQTAVPAGRYVYDVILNDGNRVVSGLATINPAIA
jgi:hypothetical protein